MSRFDQTLLIVVTVVTGVLVGLLLALPVAYVILLIAGADEPFADPGDSTALGLLYTALMVAVLVVAGNGLRWCVEWLRSRSGGTGPAGTGA
jgi:hypothetical protein